MLKVIDQPTPFDSLAAWVEFAEFLEGIKNPSDAEKELLKESELVIKAKQAKT